MADAAESIAFYDHHPEQADLEREVLNGLAQKPRAIPPKFFYDERGSELFAAICRTPEYYPTRTETGILRDNLEEIARLIGADCLLVEPGSGNSQKVRILLDAIKPNAYMPMDISREYLRAAAEDLAAEYPWLDVHAACTDFTSPLKLPYCPPRAPKVAFFPGSSIGNFDPQQARRFLGNIAAMVGPGGALLIGVDVKKDPAILDAAYNDAQGATAAFNKNLLLRINNELGADFDLAGFQHRAFYNEDKGRVEMHLESTRLQTVHIKGRRFEFTAGESVHTESSYKYRVEEFQDLARAAGFSPLKVWTDSDALFSVHYLQVSSS